MTEQAIEATAPELETAEEPKAPAKPPTLEELLADLDEDRRKIILDQVAKPRNEAKNLRDRLKALEPKAAELDRLEAASKSDADRAQEALTAATARAVAAQARWARAEVKAALAGVVDDPDSIVEDLNLARFVTEDGEVDADAVKALRAKYAGFSGRRPPRPDASQASGANGKSVTSPAETFGAILQTAMHKTR